MRSPAPSTRLKPVFAICEEVTRAADKAAADAGPAHAGTQTQFERSFFFRGNNTLKAASLVAGDGYWEVAATCARQLFELVLNMEYIAQDEDRVPASMVKSRVVV